MKIRQVQPKDDEFLFNLIRSCLEDADLNIPGTAYFDESIKKMSEFRIFQDFKSVKHGEIHRYHWSQMLLIPASYNRNSMQCRTLDKKPETYDSLYRDKMLQSSMGTGGVLWIISLINWHKNLQREK